MRRPYTLGQLREALAHAEAQWAAASWATAGVWKSTVHALRDRIALQQSLEVIK